MARRAGAGEPTRVPIERIRPNPNQPRRDFDERELQDLAASIREKGVIQPLILRPHPVEAGHYEIVAGERRWRAAQMAGVHELPAVVRDLTDTEVLELAIIENIQRADLNPLEEAQGYRQLMDRFGHTQERLAEALGKSRSHIANLLRLLTLPEPVLEMLRAGKLTAGHARALVTARHPEALARQVVERDLSVRQTEQLARERRRRRRRRGPAAAAAGEGRRHPRARGRPDGHAATEGQHRAPAGPAGRRAADPLRDARGARRALPAAVAAEGQLRRAGACSTASSTGRPAAVARGGRSRRSSSPRSRRARRRARAAAARRSARR